MAGIGFGIIAASFSTATEGEGQMVRYMRLSRTYNGSISINCKEMTAYQKDRMWIPVAGEVVPFRNTNYDWDKLNDSTQSTSAWTLDSPNAYIELDLGVGGKKTDRVFLDLGTTTTSIYGVTFTIMDPTRYVIFQYTFYNDMETGYETKTLTCGINTILEPQAGQNIRYLRFERVSDPEAINLAGMEAYQYNNPC